MTMRLGLQMHAAGLPPVACCALRMYVCACMAPPRLNDVLWRKCLAAVAPKDGAGPCIALVHLRGAKVAVAYYQVAVQVAGPAESSWRLCFGIWVDVCASFDIFIFTAFLTLGPRPLFAM